MERVKIDYSLKSSLFVYQQELYGIGQLQFSNGLVCHRQNNKHIYSVCDVQKFL